jgi:hypothetical protein
LVGAFAILVSQSLLFLQRRGRLAGAFARACVCAGALATHGQATAMAEATVATDVHQSLDVHGRFATQITFDGELTNLVADFFQVTVSQILDLLGIGDATSFANFSGAGATNPENGSQANFRMLLRRNIDTSDTCHFCPLKLLQSTLALFVPWIRTDHTHHTLAPDNFAVAANFLDRSRNFHFILLKL